MFGSTNVPMIHMMFDPWFAPRFRVSKHKGQRKWNPRNKKSRLDRDKKYCLKGIRP